MVDRAWGRAGGASAYCLSNSPQYRDWIHLPTLYLYVSVHTLHWAAQGIEDCNENIETVFMLIIVATAGHIRINPAPPQHTQTDPHPLKNKHTDHHE